MRKIELKSRKWLRTIFGTFSFTAMAFVFQACYGTGPDDFYDIKLTGTVKSKTTNLPIKGIKVMVNDGETYYGKSSAYGITDENGKFDFYADVPNGEYYSRKDSVVVIYTHDSVRIHFLDIDGIENGNFADKTIIIDPARKDEVKINVELEDKQEQL